MLYEQWPYLCVFGVVVAAGLGLPIPEDIPLLTGGYLCHAGYANLGLMIAFAMVGVFCGDLLLFSMGRKFGHHIVEHRFIRRLVRPSRLLMAERLFERHGLKIIFVGRFLPGLRAMIFLAAGVLKVPVWTFVGVNGFAICISVPALVVLGRLFGHNLDQLQQGVRTASHLVALGGFVVVLAVAMLYFHRRQKRMMASVGVDDKISPETLAHLAPGGNIPIPESGSSVEEPVPETVSRLDALTSTTSDTSSTEPAPAAVD